MAGDSADEGGAETPNHRSRLPGVFWDGGASVEHYTDQHQTSAHVWVIGATQTHYARDKLPPILGPDKPKPKLKVTFCSASFNL